MAASIPASAIVNILPGVISAGGNALDLVGLLLTQSTQIPIGSVLPFSSQTDVAAYFGPLSNEATLASYYFGSYTGATQQPGKLYISQYASAAVAGYLRGGSVASKTLAQLQALSGTLAITVGGSAKTSGTITLASATSFSNAATIIQAGFTTPGFTVSYDSVSGGFVFTNTTTGANSTMSVASGTLAAPLNLTAANGAVVSQGAAQMTPASAMAGIIGNTTDWVSFTTAWEPVDADKAAFAAWSSSINTGTRYAYVPWTNEVAAVSAGDTTTIGPLVAAARYAGIIPVYDPNTASAVAMFIMGYMASLDFARAKGRTVAAFRASTTLNVGVTNETIADNLAANGYNFFGGYATANDEFSFLYPGQISGPFDWIDSWACQVWLNNALQLALMTLLTNVGQVPYNSAGYILIEAAMAGPITDALNFGAIQPGVALSALQIAEINNLAGVDAASTVQQRGWYVSIQDPGPTVRAARGTPICTLIYTDGESVQKINVASLSAQ